MSKVKKAIVIIIIVAALAAIKIFLLNPPAEKKTKTSGNKSSVTIVTVYVAKAQALDEKLFVTGTVIANEEIVLMPEISGKIIQLNINEGTEVEKNELLVKINDADFQAQLKKLSFQVKLAEDKMSRLKQLLAISGISQEEYDIAFNQLNTLKADEDFTKAQIAKTEIRSPFKGIVGLKSVSEGTFVSPTTRIASIQQINQVKIDFSIPEKYADVINKNDPIHFTVANKNEKYTAKVYAMEPKIDFSTRTLQLRAVADNRDGKLFPGITAKIEVPLKQITDAIMVPTEAIIPVLKGQKVFVCKNGKAQERIVETGVRTDSGIQIVSGISAGDSVITTGIMQLKPGGLVKVSNESEARRPKSEDRR